LVITYFQEQREMGVSLFKRQLLAALLACLAMAVILILYQNGQQERHHSNQFQQLKQQTSATELELELLLGRAALTAQSQAVQLSSYLNHPEADTGLYPFGAPVGTRANICPYQHR
jgi:hypothetical protein